MNRKTLYARNWQDYRQANPEGVLRPQAGVKPLRSGE